MKRLLTISKTYEVVTPESAANGDFEETGFEYQDQQMSLHDLLKEVRDLGAFEWSSSQPSKHCWITSLDPEVDYSTAAETRYSIHFNDLTDKQFKRVLKLLKAGA